MIRRARVMVVALLGVSLLSAAIAADSATARPDFSGVWFPDAKASGRWPAQRPFTASMSAARDAWMKDYTPIDLTRDDENVSCIAYTLPYAITTITQYPFEIIATPRRIYQFMEVFGQVRRIDLDGVDQGDLLPSRMGLSHGRWEGKELIVETTHLLPLHLGHRFPSSPAQRVEERFRLIEDDRGKKTMQVEVKVIDPLVYAEPIIVQMVYKSAPDVALGEYICGQDLWDQHRDGSSSRIPWR
jgi:hypothetical protein